MEINPRFPVGTHEIGVSECSRKCSRQFPGHTYPEGSARIVQPGEVNLAERIIDHWVTFGDLVTTLNWVCILSLPNSPLLLRAVPEPDLAPTVERDCRRWKHCPCIEGLGAYAKPPQDCRLAHLFVTTVHHSPRLPPSVFPQKQKARGNQPSQVDHLGLFRVSGYVRLCG